MREAKRGVWRKHVRGWMSSGLSCKAYARRAGVNHHTLSWWKARLRADGERLDDKADEADFVELLPAVVESIASQPIAIDVRGVTIRVSEGFSQRALGDVLTVLGARS